MAGTMDQIRSWVTPALLVAVLALSGFIWSEQQSRIKALEDNFNNDSSALAVITTNQSNSLADRSSFQAATTARLDKMADTLTVVGNSLAALTALQQLAQRSSVNRLSSGP